MKDIYKGSIIELFRKTIKHIDDYQYDIPLLSSSMDISPYEMGAFLLILKDDYELSNADIYAIIENKNFTIQSIDEYINNRF